MCAVMYYYLGQAVEVHVYLSPPAYINCINIIVIEVITMDSFTISQSVCAKIMAKKEDWVYKNWYEMHLNVCMRSHIIIIPRLYEWKVHI